MEPAIFFSILKILIDEINDFNIGVGQLAIVAEVNSLRLVQLIIFVL